MNKKAVAGIAVAVLLVVSVIIWWHGSENPQTPAGYVGYLTRGAVFGKTQFVGLQTGPTSPGRGWLLSADNVSVTPYTFNEDFKGASAVLAKGDLLVEFSVHMVFRINPEKVKDFFEHYSVLYKDRSPDKIVLDAYNNFLKEPLRTYARDEIQKYEAMTIKDNITPIGEAVFKRVLTLTKNTPFEVTSVVVGNIQYPPSVATAVANKLAETQKKQQAEIAIETERALARKRIVEAEGIAKSMEIINSRLTNQYLQHEAVEAQKAMVGSPNHTTIYIPVGPMGLPLTGTFDVGGGKSKPPAQQKAE